MLSYVNIVGLLKYVIPCSPGAMSCMGEKCRGGGC